MQRAASGERSPDAGVKRGSGPESGRGPHSHTPHSAASPHARVPHSAQTGAAGAGGACARRRGGGLLVSYFLGTRRRSDCLRLDIKCVIYHPQ